jgi:hypothetical protein
MDLNLHSLKKQDPDPHKVSADPEHCLYLVIIICPPDVCSHVLNSWARSAAVEQQP